MFAQNLEGSRLLRVLSKSLRREKEKKKASKIKRRVKKKKKNCQDVFKRDCVMTEEYINCICF